MKKLASCVRCGETPEMVKRKTNLRDSKYHPIFLYQVVCSCGAKTGQSQKYFQVAEDWNAKQECLRRWRDAYGGLESEDE